MFPSKELQGLGGKALRWGAGEKLYNSSAWACTSTPWDSKMTRTLVSPQGLCLQMTLIASFFFSLPLVFRKLGEWDRVQLEIH